MIYLGKRGSSFLSVSHFEDIKKPNMKPVLLIDSNKLISSISKISLKGSKNCTSPTKTQINETNKFQKLNSKYFSCYSCYFWIVENKSQKANLRFFKTNIKLKPKAYPRFQNYYNRVKMRIHQMNQNKSKDMPKFDYQK